MLALLCGLAGASPLYDTRPIEPIAVESETPGAGRLKKLAKEAGVTTVEATGLPSPIAPKEATGAVAVAVGFALAHGIVDTETDLLLHQDGSALPVTLTPDGTARLTVTFGPPVSQLPPSAREPAEVGETYGVQLVDGASSWTPEAAGILGNALERLTPEERERLTGLRFVREPTLDAAHASALPEGFGAPYGAYRYDDRGARIEVFDQVMAEPGSFVGTVDAPVHPAVRALLHEIAHALAQSPHRKVADEAYALQDEYQALIKSSNERLDRLNALIQEYNKAPKASLRQQIEAEEPARLEDANRTAALEARLYTLKGPAENPGLPATVQAFQAANQGIDGPTAYGRTSPQEAWAECFSLHRTDRAALDRVAPDAASWLDQTDLLPLFDKPLIPGEEPAP